MKKPILMKSHMRYTPTQSGFSVCEGYERFNRMLYGSHKNDDKNLRFVTFAGDVPQFMGGAIDWTVNIHALMAKRGTLFSGLAITPGQRVGGSTETWEAGARWFHDSNDINGEFKAGWMEYELTEMSCYFPEVYVQMEAYPLHPDDGFLIRYRITTDQRVVFVAGFGGITDYFTDLTHKAIKERYFHAEDCANNTIAFGENCACVRHTNGHTVHIGTSFRAKFEAGSAKSM